jgi:hypothetical protein
MLALTRFLTILGFLAAAALPAQAGFSFIVNAETSSLAGTAGSIEFQYNAVLGSTISTATINDFTIFGGTLNAVQPPLGTVVGMLPAPVSITTSSPVNSYLHDLTYGSSLQYFVTIPGAQLTDPNLLSSFTMTLYNNVGDPIRSIDLIFEPSALRIDLLGPVGAFTQTGPGVSAVATPLPPTVQSFAVGLVVMGVFRARRALCQKSIHCFA